MKCPRDETELTEVKTDDAVMERCATCGGIWFDFAMLERVLSHESRALKALLPKGGAREQDPVDTMVCPGCNDMLIRMHAPHGDGIYYACLTCYGRWLDGSEMERVVGRSLAVKFEKLFKVLLGE